MSNEETIKEEAIKVLKEMIDEEFSLTRISALILAIDALQESKNE